MSGKTAYLAGLSAEDQVARLYETHGYHLRARRWRGRGGEIDLIFEKSGEITFVEVKKSVIGPESKVNHLSYIGDAKIGEKVNIGAGTITCNYDGVNKHKTDIKDEAFIGSNTMLVAPVTIGEKSVTASGSVVTKDVPDEALAFARSRQENKTGMGKKLMNLLRKQKNKS